MSWLHDALLAARLPEARPARVIEQEIRDELEFHIAMRTLENADAGMPPDEAAGDALRRFGDVERIHKTCRHIVLGERIMFARIQVVLTVLLFGAVVFLGVAFYRGQRANEAATAQMMQVLEHLVGPSVVATVPRHGDVAVDPSLTEIRVTFDREMSPQSWSWCQGGDPASLYPGIAGEPRYEADAKTCVLPVKLEPGKSYAIRVNSGEFRNFKDASGQPAIPYLLQFKTRQ